MPIDETRGQPWIRWHDNPSTPVVPAAPRTVFPTSLEDLVALCSTRSHGERLRAAGSHYALSEAAISDNTFVETHDPANIRQALGRTLYDVVPSCLHPDFVAALRNRHPGPYDEQSATENDGFYPVHVESGKRLYQLYAELDLGDDHIAGSLARILADRYGNAGYLGSWAFSTLGGAGGQTVVGALTTGTHGGDWRYPPLADAVLALHLVADGGRHYWIEPETPTPLGAPLTDVDKLRAHYGHARFRAPNAASVDNFDVIRDDDLFNAVLVSAGRFGIIYSVVIAAVRQYSLHEEVRLTTWQDVKELIGDTSSHLYSHRFLRVGLSLTPHANFTRNLCGVTKRWNVPLANHPRGLGPIGRAERRGPVVEWFDPRIQAPRFQYAGNSHPFSHNPNRPQEIAEPSLLVRACSDPSFMEGTVREVAAEIHEFVDSSGAIIGPSMAAVAIVAGATALIILLAAFAVILLLIAAFLEWLRNAVRPTLGETMNELRAALLERSDPLERAAGIYTWQCIVYNAFAAQQAERDVEAISYAVMDGWDYLDRSCFVNGDSIEVFFDATDPTLIAYVDALIAYEMVQEFNSKAFAGYVSLRFTGPSRALLGMQRWPVTCAVEVSGLRGVTGSQELIDFAISLALNRNVRGILHWGQRNESFRSHVQQRFGDTLQEPYGPLQTWRNALGRITEHGRLDGFSSVFSRRLGLEVVTPAIGSLELASGGAIVAQPFTIRWVCDQNPAATELQLEIVDPSGARTVYGPLPLTGSQQKVATLRGTYTAQLTAALNVGGEHRYTLRTLDVHVL
jgi:hypothetical protein